MTESSLQIVERLYAAFGRRDIACVFRLLSPDVEITQSEELPWGGTYRGHEGAREFFGKLTANLQSTLEIERTIRAGDSIAAVGWTQGTVNATGAHYRVPIVHVWDVADGLIRRAQFLIDNPAMLEAIALQPQ
jgi:uncharacterized protein